MSSKHHAEGRREIKLSKAMMGS